jgi:ribosome biogenesis protein MAK21
MSRILSSGTFKDKISALSIYIRDNPRYSLKTMENLVSMCENQSKRENLTAINANKDIFIEVKELGGRKNW